MNRPACESAVEELSANGTARQVVASKDWGDNVNFLWFGPVRDLNGHSLGRLMIKVSPEQAETSQVI